MLKHINTINWSLVDKKWHEDRNERIVKLAATLDAQKGGNSMSNPQGSMNNSHLLLSLSAPITL